MVNGIHRLSGRKTNILLTFRLNVATLAVEPLSYELVRMHHLIRTSLQTILYPRQTERPNPILDFSS